MPLAQTHLRALFLSDLHLGSRGARPGAVLAFLAAHRADTIYLVGDILDLWHGGRQHWGEAAEAVMAELTRRAREGVRVVYLPGNHDAVLRTPGAARLPAGWELREALTHRAADGRRYLVLHGDQADARLLRLHAVTRLGSRVDAALRRLGGWLDRWLGSWLGGGQSPIHRVIAGFNEAMSFGGRFERRLVALAQAAGADGVICGHSHRPTLREIDGALYVNCGDWVDNATALAETHDGTLRLVDWSAAAQPAAQPFAAPARAQAAP